MSSISYERSIPLMPRIVNGYRIFDAVVLSLVPYTGGDAGQLTVNDELNKLANNVSFGHGILAGIHWRTDVVFYSIGRGCDHQHVAGRAAIYAEKFTINLTKIDGLTATISNE